jgi:hypothetical protein
MENNMNIGVDVGYSAVKGINGITAARVKFPSVLALHESVAIKEKASSAGRMIVGHGGQRWYAGTDAVDMSQHAYRRDTRDYAFTDEWRALLYTAFGLLRIPNQASISLVTGLPVDYFGDASELENLLRGKHDFEWDGKEKTVFVNQVTVTFQFYGAAMSQLQNPDTASRITNDHGVAIADGGGRTWNFGVLNKFQVVPGTSFTLDVGMWRRAIETLRPALVRRFRRELDDTELLRALEQGLVWHEREEHSVEKERDNALAPAAVEVIRTIQDKWEAHLAKVSGIFFTGGSPLLLRKWLEQEFPYAWFGTEFDNAVGYTWWAGQSR